MTRGCVAVGCGVILGLTLAVVAPWIVFNVHDCTTLKTRSERHHR